jgi:hypothetical protein
MDQARILAAINIANAEQSRAISAFNALKNKPPNKSRFSDKQWAKYQKDLQTAKEDRDRDGPRGCPKQLASGVEFKLKELRDQSGEILDCNRDALSGKDMGDRRIFGNNGLQVRGNSAGFIRTTNPEAS